jgi:hypothetical protein
MATMYFDNPSADIKPYSGSLFTGRKAAEGHEELGKVGMVDRGTVIGDQQCYAIFLYTLLKLKVHLIIAIFQSI